MRVWPRCSICEVEAAFLDVLEGRAQVSKGRASLLMALLEVGEWPPWYLLLRYLLLCFLRPGGVCLLSVGVCGAHSLAGCAALL